MLFLASFTGWWHYPRGDTRFVGQWAVQEAGTRFASSFTMTLRANGSSTWKYSPRAPGVTDYTVWKVENERLVFGFKSSSLVEVAMMRTQAGFNALPFGLKIQLLENPFDILSISKDRIELVSSSTRGRKREFTLTLRRLPE
jgi:hypothetical protein